MNVGPYSVSILDIVWTIQISGPTFQKSVSDLIFKTLDCFQDQLRLSNYQEFDKEWIHNEQGARGSNL